MTDFRAQAACQHEQQMLSQLHPAQVPDSSLLNQAEDRLCYHTELTRQLSHTDTLSLPPDRQLTLAIALTEALASLHQQDVFHLGLRPDAFLLSKDSGYAELIDLSSARHCPAGVMGLNATRPWFYDIRWLAPEQSYPSGRQADHRTDLYSLGCVLVWLFTGQPPFAHLTGEQAIAYGHIASEPDIASEKLIPPLVQLLQRLLAKDPDHRYQSCAGLLHDLKALRDGAVEGTRVTLSQPQISDRLRIPQRLYGREQETQQLMDAFERVSDGPSEAILVGGYSGVGKSALVHEIQTPILRADGLFVTGKFDQYQRSAPYSALVQAFSHFIRYLMSLPTSEVQRWRTYLNTALTPNAQVLIDLMPELESLLGAQPELPALGPDEQQNRFNRTFLTFVERICNFHKPLVIFIDDLQWADAGSIQLLQRILSQHQSRNCLLLGAYRSNEVDARHPFIQMLAQVDDNPRIQQLELAPLTGPVINELIADTVHQPITQSAPLAELIHQKTGGNPFFLRQFTQELYHAQLLHFDYPNDRWQWSVEAIQQCAISDNVVELMMTRIERLPPLQQTLLQQAAVIGAQCPLALLCQLNGYDSTTLHAQLTPIYNQGLLLPIQPDRRDSPVERARFLHDRVQQAAYARWQTAERHALHLQLGRMLLSTLDEEGLQERCFELAGHFNEVLPLLRPEERHAVLHLNYRAALKARNETAYTTSISYLRTALQLAHDLQIDAALLTEMELEQMECLYLAGHIDEAEALKERLCQRCESLESSIRYHRILITQYTRFNKLQQAIRQAQLALEKLNWQLPADPSLADVETAIADIQQRLESVPFSELVKKNRVEDPATLMLIDILLTMQPACYNSGSLLFPLTVLDLLKLTLRHGNTPCSSYVYMMYGLLCTKVLKTYDTAFSAAHHAQLYSQQQAVNPLLSGRVMMVQSNFIQPWEKPLAHSSQLREQAYHHCLAQGDYYWGVHCYIFGFYSDLFSTPSLARLITQTQQLKGTCQQINQTTEAYVCQQQLNLLQILEGSLDNSINLDHQPGFEAEAVNYFRQNNYMIGQYDRLLGRLVQGYLAGNYQDTLALTLSPELTPADLDEGIFSEAVYTLFNLLCLLALQIRGEPLTDHQQQWLSQAQQRYQSWYQLNPENFAAGYHLLQAEQAFLAEDDLEARCHYEHAVAGAACAGQALLQGIACERFAHHCHHQDEVSLTRAWLEKAMATYQDWGAHGCADRIEERLVSLNHTAQLSSGYSLDWQAVLTASREITQQQSVSTLIENFLQRVCTTTGARLVALFQPRDETTAGVHSGWTTVALCSEGQAAQFDTHLSPSPVTALNYCRHSRRTLVLHDAANRGDYVLDTRIQLCHVRSLLALPLVAQQQFVGVLYLEHDARTELFSPQKTRVMELLARQFAISWQNSQYLCQLRQYNEQLEYTIQQRTQQLDQKNRYMEAILNALPIPFVVSSLDGEVIEGNEQIFQLFEFPPEQRQQLNTQQFYVNPQDRRTLLDTLRKQGTVHCYECELRTACGNQFWGQFSSTLLELDGGEALFCAISDITERKKKEQHLHQQATTDPLTGALNRRAFTEQAPQLHKRAQRCCVAMLDLDHFKQLNDRWGHATGDEVLRQFVRTVQSLLREQDLLGRLGGEEFALVLEDVSPQQAMAIVQRICDQTAALRLRAGDSPVTFTASIGLADWPAQLSLDQALARADQQLYQAKHAGRNQVQYSPLIADLADETSD